MSSTPRTSSPRQVRHRSGSADSRDVDTAEQTSSNQTLRDYIQQVLLLCQTMMTFLQTQEHEASSTRDAATADVAAGDNDQVAFLKQKLRELVGMNVTWQQTHQTQERRIAELEEQVRQLMLSNPTSSVFSDQQQVDIDRMFQDQKNKIRQLEDENARLVQHNGKLQQQTETMGEQMQLLDMQLVTNREDFECERRDRERAQSRAVELEMELDRYRGRATFQPIHPASSQFCGVRDTQWAPWNRPTTSGRMLVDVHDGIDESDCVADCPVVARGMGSPPAAAEEPLLCPNCRKVFTKDHHADLMEHLDHCDTRSTS